MIFPSLDGFFFLIAVAFISLPALVLFLVTYISYRIIQKKHPDKQLLIKVFRMLWIVGIAGILGGVLIGLYVEFL